MSGDVDPNAPHAPGEPRWDLDDPGRDELLVEQTRPPWLGSGRRRRVVAGLVVALLAVLLGLRLVSTHRTSEATPRAAPVPQRSSATIGPSPVDVTPGRPHFDQHDPAHCPDTITCRSMDSVPAGVLAAIRQYLPKATIQSRASVAQLHPDRLYFRQVTASANGVTAVVLVSRASRLDAEPTEGTDNPPGQAIGYVRARTPDGYVVQVQFIGQQNSTPPMSAIRALAADPRLRAPG